MAGQFSGKVAIVTGSNSGIGAAIAVMMVQRGASVTLHGRDQQKLDAVVERCSKVSERPVDSFLAIAGDVADGGVRRQLVEKTVEKYGRLDILVNNAGLAAHVALAKDADEEGFDRTMEVNVKAPFFLCKLAVPHLEKSGGCIVNTSSFTSTQVAERGITYAMSKAALDHMTRCMAFEFAPLGIRVNAVNPSFVPDTSVLRVFQGGPIADPEAFKRAIELPKQPLHSACVTADDVAKLVCFLASEEARFVTGQCQMIDGGRNFYGHF